MNKQQQGISAYKNQEISMYGSSSMAGKAANVGDASTEEEVQLKPLPKSNTKKELSSGSGHKQEEFKKSKMKATKGNKVNAQKIKENEIEEEKKEYTFQVNNYASFLITAIECERFVCNETQDYWKTYDAGKHVYEYDYEKTDEVLISGRYSFTFKDRIYGYMIDSRQRQIMIEANNGTHLMEVVEHIKTQIKENSILKRKNLFLFQTDAGIAWKIMKKPELPWNKLIMREDIKVDVYDNSIMHLKEMDESNGIIFYGPPGTGKSLSCQCIINEAIEQGYSTCHMTSMIDYIELNNFLETILAPAIVIIEDIDSIGMSREIAHNNGLSVFLQFMNGISERKNRIVVIATTNHLSKLDSAIKDRPCRFNSRYEIDYPSFLELGQIIDFYFKDIVKEHNLTEVSEPLKRLCYGKTEKSKNKFSGAHIKAIQQRYILSTKKESNKGKEFGQLFSEAVEAVKKHFVVPQTPIGFSNDN